MLAVLVVGGGVVGAFVVASGGGDDFPGEWDPRVEPLAKVAERERDLDFKHPIAVKFLTPDEFEEEITDLNLTDEDIEEIEAYQGAFRALGLLEPGVDILNELKELLGGQTLAFYDPEREAAFVRGTKITVGVEVTLVHELTHALQDQHFDLTRDENPDWTSGQTIGYQALYEGDAVRIENEYVASLGSDDADAYEAETEREVERAEETDVPPIFEAFFGAPYLFGDPLLALLDEEGGNDRVDEAFSKPPTTEENLIDPFTFIEGEQAEKVAEPKLREGEDEILRDDFGALSWFFVLGERIGLDEALAAIDGWGGDAFVVYEARGRSCVRIAFQGDTRADTEEMATAISSWADAMPEGAARLLRAGDVVTLQSCDPGDDAALSVPGRANELSLIPAARAYLALGALQSGASDDQAQCIGRQFIAALSEDQLLSIEDLLFAEEVPPEIDRLFEDVGLECAEA
ncbi:MAG: hypothetical protein HYU28_03110 [Actinobacteria bacterium]|nr:hypothetical protein [Actinomycetota bacterium]